VLAVGDTQFQRKCIDVFTGLKDARKTIVLVSHDVGAVQRFCDRVFWLDKGRLVMSGEAREVVQTYLEVMTATVDAPRIEGGAESEHRMGDGVVRFLSARLETEDGRPVTQATAGSRAVLRLELVAHGFCSDPVFGFIVWQGGQVVYSTNTILLDVHPGALSPGDRCTVEIAFAIALANGRFSLSVTAGNGRDGAIHDWINHALALIVEGSRAGDGIADLDGRGRCAVEPAESPVTRAVPTR